MQQLINDISRTLESFGCRQPEKVATGMVRGMEATYASEMQLMHNRIEQLEQQVQQLRDMVLPPVDPSRKHG